MAAWEPNKRNLRDKGDYGVRVARPGYDANNCSNSQLLFNSGWPILQIVELLKLDEESMSTHYILEEITSVYDKTTGQETSHTNTVTEVPSVPAGYITTYPDTNYTHIRSIMVNKKYVLRISKDPMTIYSYQSEVIETDTTRTVKTKRCREMKYIKKSHRMGFVPMFMASEWISADEGYIVLFSVDIRTDIDYPYDDAPVPLLSVAKDYGIKSASKFGSKVPGLCSDMFSKLVQCVKTEETIQGDRPDFGPPGSDQKDNRVIWCPIPGAKLEDQVPQDAFGKFETFAYTEEDSLKMNDDGGEYFVMSYPAYLTKYDADTGVRNAWAVSPESFQAPHRRMNSLVVLRSPMVSPEYEEIVI